MKPIVIQVPSTKDGKVTLTIKELQDMLDKAYEAGKKDGTTNFCYPSTCPYKPWWYGNGYAYSGTGTITNPCDSSITWTSSNASTDATISLNNCKIEPTTSCTP